MASTISYRVVHGTAGVTPPCHQFSVPREALLQFTTDAKIIEEWC